MVSPLSYAVRHFVIHIFQPSEFAEYTSAQERIALGKKSRKKEASQRRVAMEEMIADAYVDSLSFFQTHTHVLSREEEDEETMEWEQEQLRRGGHQTPEPSSSSSKVKEIYRAAPSKQASLMTSPRPHLCLRFPSSPCHAHPFTRSRHLSNIRTTIPSDHLAREEYGQPHFTCSRTH